MTNKPRNILVTGASTGIGHAITRSLINRGYRVIGSVRREDDAQRLTSDFGDSYIPMLMDVTDHIAVENAVAGLPESIIAEGLHALVNNAGIAEGGPLQYQSQDDFEKHFSVNVFGLMRVTRACLPLLGAAEETKIPPGKIINISSVAGKFASPFVGAYVGSKHAVEGISHSLRRELLIYGIDVIIVGPGAVDTPIWDKGIRLEKYDHTPYHKILQGFGKVAKEGGEQGLSADFIGQKVARIIDLKNPKVRYAYVPNRLTNWIIPRILPARMMDRIIKKKLKV
ncbi:MAG: SDR family NAD(P)-dependent oxidoreductase [Bacteroidota bacterium]